MCGTGPTSCLRCAEINWQKNNQLHNLGDFWVGDVTTNRRSVETSPILQGWINYYEVTIQTKASVFYAWTESENC
jgi:hypothetical protein